MKAATSLVDLRRTRDRARREYLAATRANAPEASLHERGRRWRAFVEANAAYELARRRTAERGATLPEVL